MKVLLIAPKLIRTVGRFYNFPLGLAYISSALKKAGHDVSCLNLNHRENASDAVVEALRAFSPDVVGTGGLSPHFNTLQEILALVKATNPTVLTIVGGGALTSEPELVLQNTGADVGVMGEGEITVVALMDALTTGTDLSEVDGIIFKAPDGTVKRTRERDAIKDLDTLTWPDYDGFEIETLLNNLKTYDAYHLHSSDDPRALDMISSRSCPFSCTFCFHPLGKVYRERSLDDFFAELDHLVTRYRINILSVMDELFATNKDRLREFCRRIKPYQLAWTVQLHVTSVDEKVLEIMSDAGCRYISYGIESANEKVLTSMKKCTSQVRTHQALQATYDRAIGIQGNLIFGDPVETQETAVETLNWWSENRHFQISCNDLLYYPGSQIYEMALSKGAIKDRLSYLVSGGTSVNATDIEDSTFEFLRFIIGTSQQYMLLPARSVELTIGDEIDRVRGRMVTLKWMCFHCGVRNIFNNIPFESIGNMDDCATIRLTCRECNRRSDVPTRPGGNLFPVTTESAVKSIYHNLQLRENDQNKIDSGLAPTAESQLRTILEQSPGHPLANYLLGTLSTNRGESLSAIEFMRKAIRGNPYVPLYFEGMALALRKMKYYVYADLFQKQSILLRRWERGLSFSEIMGQVLLRGVRK